jgi:2-amino-4-hydroxy-6-hydroxymethyldihydropteridine diphosphokinase
MHRFFLALGANLGRRREALQAALRALEGAGVPLDRFSSIHETRPVGGPAGAPRFLNLVASGPLDGRTPPPRLLLERLLETEARLGRSRRVRNAPRRIDLDLLLYGDLVLREPGLCLPHPRLHERRFVLAPLCELDPGLVHPLLGLTAAELLATLPDEEGTARRREPLAGSPESSCGPGRPVL